MNYPKKLYKYRSFNPYTLRLLCEDKVYYADPKSFNDPLDCKPTIENDLDIKSLKTLYQKMFVTNSEKHISQAFELDRYFEENNGKTIGEYKVEKSAAFKNSASTRCSIKESEARDEAGFIQELTIECKKLLYNELASWGVLSLAKKWDCPLMWSHYADNHHGICIEYDIDENQCHMLNSVDYSGQRSIKASDLLRSELDGSREAWQKILDSYFFTKASDWIYEKEWRCLSSTKQGEIEAPFRISGIYFGIKCDSAVIKTIFLLLCNQKNPTVSFYKVNDPKGDFCLNKNTNKIDFDQMDMKYAGGFLLAKPDNRLLSEFIL